MKRGKDKTSERRSSISQGEDIYGRKTYCYMPHQLINLISHCEGRKGGRVGHIVTAPTT